MASSLNSEFVALNSAATGSFLVSESISHRYPPIYRRWHPFHSSIAIRISRFMSTPPNVAWIRLRTASMLLFASVRSCMRPWWRGTFFPIGTFSWQVYGSWSASVCRRNRRHLIASLVPRGRRASISRFDGSWVGRWPCLRRRCPIGNGFYHVATIRVPLRPVPARSASASAVARP
jgi:hypothetical protein